MENLIALIIIIVLGIILTLALIGTTGIHPTTEGFRIYVLFFAGLILVIFGRE